MVVIEPAPVQLAQYAAFSMVEYSPMRMDSPGTNAAKLTDRFAVTDLVGASLLKLLAEGFDGKRLDRSLQIDSGHPMICVGVAIAEAAGYTPRGERSDCL